MSLGIVVTTLGRAEALDRLLASLDGRLSAGDRLVVVAQDRTNEVACALEARPGLSDVATVITSARGAALGRDFEAETDMAFAYHEALNEAGGNDICTGTGIVDA